MTHLPAFAQSGLRKLFLLVALISSIGLQSASAQASIEDPFEPLNRKVFWFNEQFDDYIFKPVAEGYDFVVPSSAQRGVNNFFQNLAFPKYLVSDLVQLKFAQAGEHSLRFLLNSTVGLAGLIDIADDLGFPHHEEDFGVALGYHGVPSGPYLVLPFLGPSSVRDALGTGVDMFLNPIFYLGYAVEPDSAVDAITYSAMVLEAIQIRANLLDTTEFGKESSTDYYLFVQSSYLQFREGLIYDGMLPDEFDEEDEWDDEPEIVEEID